MTYLTSEQVDKLIAPIHPGRIHRDDKGYSHVQAYEIKAHLNRIFGFARWSQELLEYRPLFEMERPKTNTDGTPQRDKHGDQKIGYTVAYAATVCLTICAPDGAELARYTEAAVGTSQNLPDRGDAHDLAIKTAESQALKRCASTLGDQFGLSLYRNGSTDPIVCRTLVRPDSGTVIGSDSEVDLQSPGVEDSPSIDEAQVRINTIRARHTAELPRDQEGGVRS